MGRRRSDARRRTKMMKNSATKMRRKRVAGPNRRDVDARRMKWTKNNVQTLKRHQTKHSKIEQKKRETICSPMGRNHRVNSRKPNRARALAALGHGTGRKRAIMVHLMSLPKKRSKHQLIIHSSV